MSAPSNWPRNRLLLALPSRNLSQLLPELEHVRCQREQILMDADSSLDNIFFPDSGVVSVMAVYSDGGTIEMATIGREGCTGLQAVFGVKSSSVRLFVQIPGTAAKMSRAAFARAMGSMPSFRSLIMQLRAKIVAAMPVILWLLGVPIVIVIVVLGTHVI
jgi:CRP-like cAMP-binding protein